MHLQRLTDRTHPLFDQAFRLYQSSFPLEERRDTDEHYRVLDKADYHMDMIMDDETFLGVMLYWETADLVYLEHFTTCPEVRNRGIGAKALGLLKEKGKSILLEIESPVDELTCRRYGFYQRNGFVMNPHYHIQAKYHLGDPDLELKILSWPQVLSRETYLRFLDYMTREIGILPQFSGDTVIRPMVQTDDKLQVAKLIYLSDDYIYPNWFDTMEQGLQVLAAMTELDTLYHRSNVRVAVLPDGHIAGALVTKHYPIEERQAPIREAFRLAGVPCDERTDDVFRQYYEKMRGSTEGLYIANLAVDPACRGKGIAAALLQAALQNEPLCHLECVQANIGAWRLYQRLGFTIVEEYPGVHGVPCFRMIYDKRG